jgi:hypothetical protein
MVIGGVVEDRGSVFTVGVSRGSVLKEDAKVMEDVNLSIMK